MPRLALYTHINRCAVAERRACVRAGGRSLGLLWWLLLSSAADLGSGEDAEHGGVQQVHAVGQPPVERPAGVLQQLQQSEHSHGTVMGSAATWRCVVVRTLRRPKAGPEKTRSSRDPNPRHQPDDDRATYN